MRTARPQPHKSPAALARAITHSPRILQHNYPASDTNELGPATCSKLITAQHGPSPIKTMTAFCANATTNKQLLPADLIWISSSDLQSELNQTIPVLFV